MNKKILKKGITIALSVIVLSGQVPLLGGVSESEIVEAGDDVVIPNDETGIPDSNLYYLYGDTNNDGVLTVGEAKAKGSLIFCVGGVKDLTGIEYFENIESLDASRCKIKDITPLKKLKKLKIINLRETEITDISGLPDVESLESLYLGETDIEDITPLSKYSAITHLDLSYCYIKDISPLANVKCSNIDVSNNFIEDVSVLRNMKELCDVDLSHNLIVDVSALNNHASNGHKGTWNFSYNRIKEINCLELCNGLRVNLSHNVISKVTSLKECDWLSLNLSYNKLTQMPDIEGCSSIELDLSHNQIDRLSSIKESGRLDCLDLSYNAVVNLQPLEEGEVDDLIISHNDIENICPLQNIKMERLDATNNKIEDISCIFNFYLCKEMDFTNNPIADTGVLDKLVDSCKVTINNNVEEITENPYINVIEHHSQRRNLVVAKEDADFINSICKQGAECGEITYVSKDYSIELNWEDVKTTRYHIGDIWIIGYKLGRDVNGKLILKDAKKLENMWHYTMRKNTSISDNLVSEIMKEKYTQYDLFEVRIRYTDPAFYDVWNANMVYGGDSEYTRFYSEFITFQDETSSVIKYADYALEDVSTRPVLDVSDYNRLDSSNREQNVLVKTNNNILLLMHQGRLEQLGSQSAYDFSTTKITSYNEAKEKGLPKGVTSSKFLSRIDVANRENVSNAAYMRIYVGVDFAGVKMNCYGQKDKRSYDKLSTSCVDSEGYLMVQHMDYETYVLSMTAEMGDVNEDGVLDLQDAQMTLKGALKITNFTNGQKRLADVDGKFGMSLADAQKILKAALKIEAL